MYPIRYEADFAPEQDRLKAIFRAILAVPWYILGSLFITGAFIVAFIAWFALLFTGRYPDSFYEFNAGILRFTARASAFFYLQTEQWPPFGLEEDPTYPIRVEIDPPLERYNRWKVLFRLILAIPVMFMLYLIPYVTLLAAVIAWFHIAFTGRSSGGVHNALTLGLAYQLRATAYFLLMTETLPPVSDQAPAGALTPATQPKTLKPTAGTRAKSGPKQA